MKALIIGNKDRHAELISKIPPSVSSTHFSDWQSADTGKYDLVFDLNFDDFPSALHHFANKQGTPVFVSAVKKSLSQQLADFGRDFQCELIGMNCLPGFINREIVEISLYKKNHATVEAIMQKLGWKFKIVNDRVGMITPRIVCMIINEACYTLQEGTASMQDIDTSMKLGTNYPFGPFEWADKIGIKDVYETLNAIYEDTRDERYKICPLLKTKYVRKEGLY